MVNGNHMVFLTGSRVASEKGTGGLCVTLLCVRNSGTCGLVEEFKAQQALRDFE